MIAPPPWLDPSQAYLLGISGGRDSIALYHWLLSHRFHKIIPCHLNHGLRAAESDADEAFLKELIGPSLLCQSIDVAALAAQQKTSLETAARQARHHFFQDCARTTGLSQLLLAHHADDQAETILFNLLRGSAGSKGMSSQHQINELHILRPFLKVRRSEIDAFIKQGQYPYREDSSNTSPFATRNRIRHEALPLLAQILDRDPVPGLLRSLALSTELEEIAQTHLDSLNILDPQGRIHLPSFRTLPTAIQKKALHRFLNQHGIPELSSKIIDRALTLLSPDAPASLNLPSGLRLRRKESRLFISP